MYEAVGAALSAWERVEESIAKLALVFSRVKDAEAATAVRHIFGSIESSSVRLNVVQTLAEIHFGQFWKAPEIGKRFNQLKAGITSASHRRNEIAHGTLAPNLTVARLSETGEQINDRYGCFLVASEYLISRNRSYNSFWDMGDPLAFIQSKYRYTASDVWAFEGKFNALNTFLIQYAASCNLNEAGLPRNVFQILQERPEKGEPLT